METTKEFVFDWTEKDLASDLSPVEESQTLQDESSDDESKTQSRADPPFKPKPKPRRRPVTRFQTKILRISRSKPEKPEVGSVLVAEKDYPKFDRLLVKAEAEGRIDGEHKCLSCGMRYHHKSEARECCKIL